MEKIRTVLAYKNYTADFLEGQTKKIRDKFFWTFEIIEDLESVPKTYFKHLDDGIYEVRVKFGSNIYRIFAFFDEDKLVLTINGFQKKTQKTPKSEIKRAKTIRIQYYEEKK